MSTNNTDQRRTGDSSSYNISIEPASPSADEYFKSIDDRVNRKIAAGLKKAVHLIKNKFDSYVQEWLSIMITEEIEIRIKELKSVRDRADAQEAL